MSLTINFENLGMLRQGELTLGDITIITGENNTGKSNLASALHGLLWMYPECAQFDLDEAEMDKSVRQGGMSIDLEPFVEQFQSIVDNMCNRYVSQLDRVLYTYPNRIENAKMSIQADASNLKDKAFENTIEFGYNDDYDDDDDDSKESTHTIKCVKPKGSMRMGVSFHEIQRMLDIQAWGIDDTNFPPAKSLVNTLISHVMLGEVLPTPFIINVDRTGLLLFNDQLKFSNIPHLNKIAQKDRDVDLSRLFRSGYPRYPLPIHEEIDFIQHLDIHEEKSKSKISETHPTILDEFSCIAGGDYIVEYNSNKMEIDLYFNPKNSRYKLKISEWSSMVKSLASLGLYLRYGAKPGDLLMIEHPEIGLHPASQRWMARLLAQLANAGIKVFIVTHSDYIAKEMNTLIMLNQDEPHCKRIAQENGYTDDELLKASQIKSYETKKALVAATDKDNTERHWQWMLAETEINEHLGMEVPNFDKTINNMNNILEDIIWGAE